MSGWILLFHVWVMEGEMVRYYYHLLMHPCMHVFTSSSGSCDSTAKVWDVRARRCSMTLRGHQSDINSVHLFPDGKCFATGTIPISIPCDNTYLYLSTYGCTYLPMAVTIPMAATMAISSCDPHSLCIHPFILLLDVDIDVDVVDVVDDRVRRHLLSRVRHPCLCPGGGVQERERVVRHHLGVLLKIGKSALRRIRRLQLPGLGCAG